MDIENFQVGIEVETPTLPDPTYDPLRSYGTNSSSLYRTLEREEVADDTMYGWAEGGRITSDISVGAEIVSGPEPDELGGIPITEAADWYGDTIRRINRYETHVPVGLMDSSNQTAGLHIHFSHPDTDEVRDFAEWLYNLSADDEWLRVFACSSIADRGGPTTGQVFRGDRHVKFNGFGESRPNAVAVKSAANGHYEWRMPEPMTTGNFELLMEFLMRAIEDDGDAAVDWASELVYQGDRRLTSIARARSIGLDSYEPPTTIDGLQVVRGISPDTHAFHDAVYDSPAMPFIYRIHTEDGRFGETYYMLVSHRINGSIDPLDGYEHLFATDRGTRWVVEDLGNGGLTLAEPEVEADLIDAAARVTDDTESDIESTAATEVLLDAL